MTVLPCDEKVVYIHGDPILDIMDLAVLVDMRSLSLVVSLDM